MTINTLNEFLKDINNYNDVDFINRVNEIKNEKIEINETWIKLCDSFEDMYNNLSKERKSLIDELLILFYSEFYRYIKEKESNIKSINYIEGEIDIFYKKRKGYLRINLSNITSSFLRKNRELKNICINIICFIFMDNYHKLSNPYPVIICNYNVEKMVKVLDKKYYDILDSINYYFEGLFLKENDIIYNVKKDFVVKFNELNDTDKKVIIDKLTYYYEDVYNSIKVYKSDDIKLERITDILIKVSIVSPKKTSYLFFPKDIESILLEYPRLKEIYDKLSSLAE